MDSQKKEKTDKKLLKKKWYERICWYLKKIGRSSDCFSLISNHFIYNNLYVYVYCYVYVVSVGDSIVISERR